MTDVTPKLAWKGVSKRFEGRAVLDGLDLSVAPGKSLVIIGGSGQGKSVTIKTALGLMRPDAGKIELDGKNTVGLSEGARRKLFSRVGVLFQGAALFDSLTIWENVAFRLINADGVPRKEAKERAVEALEQVRLAHDVADRFPSELSGGMQKRAGLARAVVAQPEILFFDEPTIWENVAFRLINADGVPRKEAKDRAIEALEQVRLAPAVADRFPSELSGGMQKRAGLARAVVAQPEILFFDEPTTGLDPITAAAINELISNQVRRLGSTAVSITHDLASAQTIGDEIAMLHNGKIIWRGPAAELSTTDNPYVRQFVEGRAEGPISHAI